MDQTPTLAEVQALFAAHGGTDSVYLAHHFPRFVETKRNVSAGLDRARGNRVLDIGAHWLHQSILYALDGFSVTALDLPLTFQLENVKRFAEFHGIDLIPNEDLEKPLGLASCQDDSFDLVLFTEIIEHITFNPVALWREIYRVLKPGGRIVITTPNYYAFRGRAWHWSRFLKGFGGGLGTLDVLSTHTYGHHWKEYSLREIIYYFCVLSPDFVTVKALRLEEFEPARLRRARERFALRVERIAPILRPNLHVEVELLRKKCGITIQPAW